MSCQKPRVVPSLWKIIIGKARGFNVLEVYFYQQRASTDSYFPDEPTRISFHEEVRPARLVIPQVKFDVICEFVDDLCEANEAHHNSSTRSKKVSAGLGRRRLPSLSSQT